MSGALRMVSPPGTEHPRWTASTKPAAFSSMAWSLRWHQQTIGIPEFKKQKVKKVNKSKEKPGYNLKIYDDLCQLLSVCFCTARRPPKKVWTHLVGPVPLPVAKPGGPACHRMPNPRWLLAVKMGPNRRPSKASWRGTWAADISDALRLQILLCLASSRIAIHNDDDICSNNHDASEFFFWGCPSRTSTSQLHRFGTSMTAPTTLGPFGAQAWTRDKSPAAPGTRNWVWVFVEPSHRRDWMHWP